MAATPATFLGGDATLIAPVIPGPTTPADFRAFVQPRRPIQFRAVQLFSDSARALRRVRQHPKYELADDINFTVKGIWNTRKSKNQAAPLPFGIGAAAGITPVLDATSVDATNPFNPFGVTLGGSKRQVGAIFRPIRRRRPAPVRPNSRHALRRCDPGRVVRYVLDDDWYWDVNGAYGENEAKQKMLGNINSGQASDRARPACYLPGNARLRTVQFVRRRRVNHPGDDGLCDVRSARQQRAEVLGFDRQPVGQPDRASGRSARASRWARISRPQGSVRSGSGGGGGLQLGHSCARQRRADTTSRKPMLELNAPLLADRPFAELLELNGAVRFSDYSTSGSTTTFKAGLNWKPIKDLRLRGIVGRGLPRAVDRRIVRHTVALRPATGRSLLVACRQHGAAQLPERCVSPRKLHRCRRSRQRQLSAGQPADFGPGRRQPEPGSGNVEELGAWGGRTARHCCRASRSRPIGTTIKIDGAIQPVDARVHGHSMRRQQRSGRLRAGHSRERRADEVAGLPRKYCGHRDARASISTCCTAPRDRPPARFGFTWNNTFLRNYDVIVPATGGETIISREGTEQGSPSPGLPQMEVGRHHRWDSTNSVRPLRAAMFRSSRRPAAT